MKMMKRGGLAALFAVVAMAAPVSAQDFERDIERECRCVDADGTEIERCTCFRTPNVEALVTRMGAFAPGQPRLGISIDPRQASRDDAEGALVTDVLDDGPADRAGLRKGDVITSVDGTSLTTPLSADVEGDFDLDDSVPVQRLLVLTGQLEPGETVEVEYLRDGQRQTTMVEVEDLSGRWGEFSMAVPSWDQERFQEQMRTLTDGARSFRMRVGPDQEAHFFGDRGSSVVLGGGRNAFFFGDGLHADGLELAEVNPGLGEYFGTDEGVLVLETGRSSGLGLEAGDVVLRIGSRDVTTPERFRRILSSYGDDEDIDFHVLRDGDEIVVTGRLRY
jgi:hypothetical protein